MRRNTFEDMTCSVARTLDVIGDRWTPLIVRDLNLGISRFDALQRNLGISRKVLSQRLAALEEHGVVERVPYQQNPPRDDYVLTEKGADLGIVLLALATWGDRWTAGDEGPPMVLRHDTCGEITTPVPTCAHCGEELRPGELTQLPGPGFAPGIGTSEIPAALERRGALR